MSRLWIATVSWIGHLVACHYVFRHIRDHLARATVTLSLCLLLSYISCHDLPEFQMSSIAVVSLCWIISIRIIHLTVFSPNEPRTFRSFVCKVFWTLFPLMQTSTTEKRWPIVCDFLLGCVKLSINDWIIRWVSHCGGSGSYGTVILYSFMILTGSYSVDIQIAFVRLVTRDKYTLLSWSNWPLLSTSLREFWGQRYNRLTSTVLRESVFKPIRSTLSSPTVAALATFIVSGLLHVHNVIVAFNDPQAIAPTFAFFLLHGMACWAETCLAIRLPAPFGWLMTHFFLAMTAPLVLGPFSRRGRAFFEVNPPPLAGVQWMPKLPVPNFCPQ